MNTNLVPVNTTGKPSDMSFSVTLAVHNEALSCFRRAYKRMLNPPVWHELCGTLSASFVLTDGEGNELHRLAAADDYIRIHIPGPGTVAGDGYDWVKIDVIDDDTNPEGTEEMMGMRVHPAPNPKKDGNDTAHFFQNTASSAFVIQRSGNTVTASYHGRNEVPNAHTGTTIDNIRNTIIASGAFAGLSELQWSALVKAFLEAEI